MATQPSPRDDEAADQEHEALVGKAERCRRLARGISDHQASEILQKMADGYDRTAAQLKTR